MIAILSSCSGYGTYVPALRISEELSENNIKNEVFVYENYFEKDNLNVFINYRKQFHESFRFAQIATSMSTFNDLKIRFDKIDKDFNSRYFTLYIVITGTWLRVLEKLNIPNNKIICLRPDTVDSPSWKSAKETYEYYNNIWLIGMGKSLPNYILNNKYSECERSRRVIMHGGGWGINTFTNKIKKLYNNYEVLTIHSTEDEAKQYAKEFGIESFYTPINWLPNMNEYSYPPLINVENGRDTQFHIILNSCCAVISKPGGGTCLDAITMKVPPIFLEGMAEHEKSNMLNMTSNHIGVDFNTWELNNYSYDVLLDIKENLVKKLLNKRYLYEYISELIKV